MFRAPCSRSAAQPWPVALSPSSLSSSLFLPGGRSPPAGPVSRTHCFFFRCRDAAWELEPGAFSELYQRHQHCDAPVCLYERGRDSFEDEG